MTTTTTPQKFARLVKKHTDALLEGLSPEKLLTVDFLDLNREAIKLAQAELQEPSNPLESDEVKQELKPLLERIKRTSFVKPYQATDTEAMGMLISKFFEWAGEDIMEAAYYALEDANFHGEAKAVLDLLNGETVIEK